MIRRFFLFICFTIISTSLFASNTATTLLDLYRMALQNNPAWVGFQEDVKQSELQVQASKGQLRPQIGLTGSYDYYYVDSDVAQAPNLSNDQINNLNQCLIDNNDYNLCLGQVAINDCEDDPACLIAQSGSNQNYTTKQLGIQLKQPIYNPEISLESQQASVKLQQAKYKALQNQQAFLQQLIETYLMTLSTREQYQMHQQELALNQKQLAKLEQQFEKGLVPASEVLYARAMLNLQLSEVQETQENARNAYAGLENIAQQTIPSLAGLDQSVPMPKPVPATYEEWIAIASSQSPLIAENKSTVTLSNLEKEKRESNHKPQIHLVAGVGISQADGGNSLNNGNRTSASVGVQVSMPLYTGHTLSALTTQASSLQSQALLNLRSTQGQLNTDITSAFNAAARGLNQMQLLDSAISALKLQVENLETGFEKGVVEAEKVLDARQKLFQTRQNRQLTRFDYIRASIKLKRLAGVLSQNDIAIIASWSDLANSAAEKSPQSLFDGNKSWLSFPGEVQKPN